MSSDLAGIGGPIRKTLKGLQTIREGISQKYVVGGETTRKKKKKKKEKNEEEN